MSLFATLYVERDCLYVTLNMDNRKCIEVTHGMVIMAYIVRKETLAKYRIHCGEVFDSLDAHTCAAHNLMYKSMDCILHILR